ncbi:LysR family transcriptional regulator [Thorsellia anophelis]|uniref:DNA-binding transcriptional regulator, LysR family n=1 Tax=Thorsellia anophelis DSM 18579 TaxID=1123402 RepID=A0A1I0EC37_9GAMM|nr:LysR family transcriptional regulator [Thorsellia anophelis]SET42013.1 DNA-binding transcriptional regulator, LysR family [Thorsellia anophelis DSM 18579]
MKIEAKTDELIILVAVYDAGSFSAAARQLTYPIAKITRAIANLELAYQLTLFTRTTRRIVPTEECHRFVERVRQILLNLEASEQELMQVHVKPRGWLRVDAVSSFVLHQLVPLVSQFKLAYPDISIELMTNDNIIDLIEKKTDVAIRVGLLTDSNLYATSLGKSQMHIVASPYYFRDKKIPDTLSELLSHDMIGFTRQSKLNRWPLSKAYLSLHPEHCHHSQLAGEYLQITPCLTASSGEAVLQLCLAGHGIALLSNFTVKAYLDSGQLIKIMPDLISSNHPRNEVNAVYYKNRALSKRISVFIDFLQANLSL